VEIKLWGSVLNACFATLLRLTLCELGILASVSNVCSAFSLPFVTAVVGNEEDRCYG
jgi:hypothetical protein